MDAKEARWKLTRTQAAVVAIALLAAPARAGEAVDIRVRQYVSIAPATLAFDIVVEKDMENRAIKVCVDSGQYYRSSVVQLDGHDAPRITSLRYADLPAGGYEIKAIVFGPGEKPRATVSRHVEVLARAGQ